MIERTPTEFRLAYNEWNRTAPANDSDIIPDKPRRSVSPRHADLSKELQGLLFWRHLNKDVQPLSTNWMVPDNENNSEKEDDEPRTAARSRECEHVIKPSVDELVAAAANVGPNVEYGEEYEVSAPLDGNVRPLARLGSIRFSTHDSNQDNRDPSPPRGSIIRRKAEPNTLGFLPEDYFGAPLGSDEDQEDIDSSNQFFAEMLNTNPHRYLTGGSSRLVHGVASPSRENWAVLPCGSRRVSDSFIGHKICSEQDDCRDDEPADEWIVRSQERCEVRAQLSSDDTKALDTAIHASNFQEIGEAFDFEGKTAERQGIRLLMAANKNLSAVIDRRIV